MLTDLIGVVLKCLTVCVTVFPYMLVRVYHLVRHRGKQNSEARVPRGRNRYLVLVVFSAMLPIKACSLDNAEYHIVRVWKVPCAKRPHHAEQFVGRFQKFRSDLHRGPALTNSEIQAYTIPT